MSCEKMTALAALRFTMANIRIKICCIASIAEAAVAVRHGAAAVGLVSKMPSGPGPIPEPLIAQIAGTVPPTIGTFLLTSEQEVEPIIHQQRSCRVNTLQIVDRLSVGTYDHLRELAGRFPYTSNSHHRRRGTGRSVSNCGTVCRCAAARFGRPAVSRETAWRHGANARLVD